MKIRDTFTCPLELSLDLIKGKWKPIIIWLLRKGPSQLSSLEKEIEGINQKMLIQHLKELVDFNIVSKKIYDGYPLKVEYSLTAWGERYLDGLLIFQQIGKEFLEQKNNISKKSNGHCTL